MQTRIVIQVSGGTVTHIMTNTNNIQIQIIDHDNLSQGYGNVEGEPQEYAPDLVFANDCGHMDEAIETELNKYRKHKTLSNE